MKLGQLNFYLLCLFNFWVYYYIGTIITLISWVTAGLSKIPFRKTKSVSFAPALPFSSVKLSLICWNAAGINKIKLLYWEIPILYLYKVKIDCCQNKHNLYYGKLSDCWEFCLVYIVAKKNAKRLDSCIFF